MKTSFYFVLWIIVYPILDLLGISSEYSFIVALLAICGISYLVNKNMSGIIAYDRISFATRICETAYTGKIESIIRDICGNIVISVVSAVYMAIMTALLLYDVIRHQNYDIFALVVFALIAWGCLTQLLRLIKARTYINEGDINNGMKYGFGVDYDNFFEVRQRVMSASELLPPRPKYYAAYLAVSILFAIICALLGLAGIIFAIILSVRSGGFSVQAGISISILYLYSGLAFYFGLRDTISTLKAQKTKVDSLN